MGSLFNRGGGQQQIQLPKPRIVRQPTQDDPSVLAAAERAKRRSASGRRSTILTDALQERIGSSGQALGA